jgi:hypothetical protein
LFLNSTHLGLLKFRTDYVISIPAFHAGLFKVEPLCGSGLVNLFFDTHISHLTSFICVSLISVDRFVIDFHC